eukprot:scaffold529_cov308-Pinguiococcus_pyrenoidosus.AAC.93
MLPFSQAVEKADQERREREKGAKHRANDTTQSRNGESHDESPVFGVPPPPAGLRGLQQLRQLLAKDEEDDPLPMWAQEAVGLRNLSVAGAEAIGDYGLEQIAKQCCTLTELNISGATLCSDVALRSLAMACDLKQLKINGCRGFSAAGLSVLGETCPRLQGLSMVACRQIAAWGLVKIFHGCAHLQHLDTSFCPIVTDEELRVLGANCHNLLVLRARECVHVSDAGIVCVANGCPRLTALDVSRSQFAFRITDIALMALGEKTPNLSTLNMSGCSMLSDAGMSWLASGCSALTILMIAESKVTNAGVRMLAAGCPFLKELDLQNANRVTDVGVRYLSEGCKGIVKLNLRGLFFLSDGMKRDFGLEGLQALCGNVRGLQDLCLAGCFQVSTKALNAIAGSGAQLRRLSVAECPKVSESGMHSVLKCCSNLESLSLKHCGDAVKDAFFQPLLKHPLPRLHTLELSGNGQLTKGVIPFLVSGCVALETLNLCGCSGLDDESLLFLAESSFRPGLRHLSLEKCQRVTDAGLTWLSDGIASLYTISLLGTRCSYGGLRVIADRYRYSRLVRSESFLGLLPLPRFKDRVLINEYGARMAATRKIQAIFRGRQARATAERLRRKLWREWTALRLQSLWRSRMARRWMELLRQQRIYEGEVATTLQCWWRGRVARRELLRRQEAAHYRRCEERCTTVQRVWRGVLGRRTARRRRKELARFRRRQNHAAQQLQRIYRGCSGRSVAREMRKRRAERLARELHSLRRIQRVYRGHRGRQRVKRLREQRRLDAIARDRAAVQIQKALRRHRCRQRLAQMAGLRRQRAKAATYLQALYRARKAWIRASLMRQKLEARRQDAASIRIQSLCRRYRARCLIHIAREAKAEHDRVVDAATRLLQRCWRGHLGRIRAKRLCALRREEQQKMERLRCWAGTTITACVRGFFGRCRAREVAHLRNGRWKEMLDKEKGLPFYYNQVSGEVRWRKPQALLDLMPKPFCDNCGAVLATTECKDCCEAFCDECWQAVHSGGRRAHHEFRALYDYYERRVDYGDGEFPSLWPSEVAMDELAGWKLRIHAGEREPMRSDGAWDVYYDDDSGRPFYYNRETRDGSYDEPWELQGSTGDGEMREALVDSSLCSPERQLEWGEHATETCGDLDSEQSALQETPSGLTPDGDDSMVMAASAASPWRRYADDARGVSYFYNSETGESTYERPADFSTPDDAANDGSLEGTTA